jgi:glutathione S-transferase
MELYGRSSSHYTRTVCMLAHERDVVLEVHPVFNLLSEDPADYAGNPALKLPVLRDGDTVVYGHLNACTMLAKRSGRPVFMPGDAHTPLLMNAHELLAHAMATEVEVVFHEVVAKRPEDATSHKRRVSLVNTLAWLDANLEAVRAEMPQDRANWFDLALYCMLTHLAFRNPIDLSGWSALVGFEQFVAARPSAQATPYRYDKPPT